MKTITFLITSLFSIDVYCQKFIDQIHIGDTMPKNIRKGGFTEEKAEDCSCRTFSIQYDVNYGLTGVGGAERGKVISIHYNEHDTVVGIITITMRMDNEDAQKVYNSRLSDFMNKQNIFKDRKLIKVRDSNNGIVDGLYYFIYSFDNGKKIRGTGVVKYTIIEETYFANSNYKPRLEK